MSGDTLTVELGNHTASTQGPPPVSAVRRGMTGAQKVWAWSWPKLIAIAIVVGIWQFLVWWGWRDEYIFPPPSEVFRTLGELMGTPRFWDSVSTTIQRAAIGYLSALVIGSLIGIAVSRIRTLRLGVGSLITGLQTMPSIAWFPFAIIVFGVNETAIFFVVVLGAAPSIANGIISGIDHVPPTFVRLGKVMGANSFSLYRHIILPAALPSYVAGLSQGWAFAWRSLMAGELLVFAAKSGAIGQNLQAARELIKMDEVMAWMIVILVIGMVADTIFTSMSRTLRRRRGLAIDD
jgi:NitT/TauT family transport system permease protein